MSYHKTFRNEEQPQVVPKKKSTKISMHFTSTKAKKKYGNWWKAKDGGLQRAYQSSREKKIVKYSIRCSTVVRKFTKMEFRKRNEEAFANRKTWDTVNTKYFCNGNDEGDDD